MSELVVEMFWQEATALVSLIVPIIGIMLIMKLIVNIVLERKL